MKVKRANNSQKSFKKNVKKKGLHHSIKTHDKTVWQRYKGYRD